MKIFEYLGEKFVSLFGKKAKYPYPEIVEYKEEVQTDKKSKAKKAKKTQESECFTFVKGLFQEYPDPEIQDYTKEYDKYQLVFRTDSGVIDIGFWKSGSGSWHGNVRCNDLREDAELYSRLCPESCDFILKNTKIGKIEQAKIDKIENKKKTRQKAVEDVKRRFAGKLMTKTE